MPVLSTLGAAIANVYGFTSGLIKDQYFNLVSLLLPGNGTNGAQNNTFLDGSSNNFTITRNGNTTQGTFSPFSQTGWGNYFSGSGQYLSLADNAAYALSNGNFTAEAWVYKPASGRAMIMGQGDGASATNTSFFFQVNASDKLEGIVTISSTDYTVTASATFLLNQWVHVALVRTGPNLALYINGSKDGEITTLSTNSLNDSPSVFSVGAFGSYGSFRWSGYISNARLVKGVAVYTGNFTPPISPLTATQSAGTNIAAITGTQTSLLTCQSNRFIDNSVANSGAGFTITPNGSPSVVAFSPFAPTQSYSAAAVGGSGYFDGAGDFLDIASATALGLNTSGDFTIEGWFYNTLPTGTNDVVFDFRPGQDLVFGFNLGVKPYYYDGSDKFSTSSFAQNSWNHVAWVRYGGSIYMYLNGVSVFTPQSSSIGSSTSNLRIGKDVNGNGILTIRASNLRILKGVAAYTGNFTPPIGQLATSGAASAAAYQSTTNVNTSFASSACSLLLNFTNAGVVDATAKNVLETVGNAQISTTQSKWGGSSMSFDGTGDWLLIPDQPQQRIGTGNFTVEMWVYRNASGTYGLVGKGTGTTGWLVSLNSSNQVVFTYGSSTITSTGTVSATTWTYIAVVREGTGTNQTKIYINGTNDGTGTVNTDFNQTNSMYIGADRTGGSAANAYVQDVRITNYARTITASPTAPFPKQ